MTYRPPFIAFDVETAENGRGSTEYYRSSFRVVSAAFSWLSEDGSIRSDYVEGEAAIEFELERICRAKIPIVAHNIEFEMGVVACRFPTCFAEAVWHADTMRLAQVYDNGGDKFALEAPLSLDDLLDIELNLTDDETPKKKKKEPKLESTAGLGLVKCVRRILMRPDHKDEAHTWLRNNIAACRPGREGEFLNELPKDILRRYNVGDTEETLRLYKFITDKFAAINYDWRLDHQLYMSSVRMIVASRIRGVPVDRARLEEYRRELGQELVDLGCQFRRRFASQIELVERSRLLAKIKKLKTFRGKKNYVKRVRNNPATCRKDVLFNVGSNKQLESLFCGVLQMVPKFKTAKGAPAFRSSVLSQWGEGGEILKRRRKRLLVLKQCESLLNLSAYDGRWHASLKACGTATGRFAGGSVV